jgi:hypothetical protein
MKGQVMSTPNNPEASILVMQFFCGVWQRFNDQQASEPHNPQTRYGFMDMRQDWSRLSPKMRQVWVDIAAEITQKQRECRL